METAGRLLKPAGAHCMANVVVCALLDGCHFLAVISSLTDSFWSNLDNVDR